MQFLSEVLVVGPGMLNSTEIILEINVKDGMGREGAGRVRMGNTCIPMADSCHSMAKTTTIL